MLLAAPAPGTYTITVRSFNVPNGPQPFALVAAGAFNQRPLAAAGPDQIVATRAFVTLDGGGSSDPDRGPSPLTYLWTQLAGPEVEIGNPNLAQIVIQPTLPDTYVFQLQVSDGTSTVTDTVTIEARRPKPR